VTWKKEMDEREDILRIEHIQRKKIEMELSREQAILAQQEQEMANKKNAMEMKIASHNRLDERAKNLKENFDKKVITVEQVHSQKDKAAEAIQSIQLEKRENRDKIHKEVNDALKRKKEEEEIEMRRRQELIKQIRELEKIPIVRTKGFDPTEAGGFGLLEEMSIAELRERIEFMKRENEQVTEKKRQQNLAKKDQEAQDLLTTASKIEEARNTRKLQNEQKRADKKREQEMMEQKRKEIKEKGI